ncbi:MAG: thiamine pyrophosphate-binding protein [Lachnospiraceae bacterium]|nr:thiamine pyrophosphate-binding protein [Lachnospiraceae bacterium]
MRVAEYLVKTLYKNGVTDVFGIPGGVVIDLLYTFYESNIKPHLSYHEQAAAFEACGFAQVNHTLGVAYATRGPGFTNLITGMADAYADSLPVLFITGHSGQTVTHEQRFEKEQEMDTVQMVRYITKYAASIDDLDKVETEVQKAISKALSGRKGPVFLDFSASLWNKEIEVKLYAEEKSSIEARDFKFIKNEIQNAKRPVFLLGDGINQTGIINQIKDLVDIVKIPVLSSRGSQDCVHGSEYYFGYIGSHGIRYANTIFQKSDLVISIGNRLAFPLHSKSFSKAIENKKIVRLEVDSDEMKRDIPNAININCDLSQGILQLSDVFDDLDVVGWLEICKGIKESLKSSDLNSTTLFIKKFIEKTNYKYLVADVGNNEFCTSHAYELSKCTGKVLYSKSFGTLGCGIGKAIGVHYRTKDGVLAIVGDQGIQLNIQELQLLSNEQLPIQILIINNGSSGMIKDREKTKGYYLHTTCDSGYGNPKYECIAKAYGLSYLKIKENDEVPEIDCHMPVIIEYVADESIELQPKLLKDDSMDNMYPRINEKY